MIKNKIYVAVVDDDDSFARALCRLLSASGFEARSFVSGEDFLAPTQLQQPDCLVLDVHLGGMSGIDLQRRLRDLGILTPVIFVTAHDSSELREEARQAGCIGYLRKPVAAHLLMEALAKAIRPGGQSPI